MLKRLSQRERIALLVETWGARIRRAYMKAVNSIRSAISIKLLVERLERADVGGAVDVLRIERDAFGWKGWELVYRHRVGVSNRPGMIRIARSLGRLDDGASDACHSARAGEGA